MVIETRDASNSGYKEKIQTIHENAVASLKQLRSSMETWASKDTKGLHVKGRFEAHTLRTLDAFADKYEDLMDKIMNMRSLDPQKRHALEVQMINAFDHAVTEYFSTMQLVWSECGLKFRSHRFE
jgi:hypothetical protein